MDHPAPQLHRLTAPLLEWYDENRRLLPWREQVSAYRTWVSEIMLQQTRVTAVLPYFERFMAAFPTVGSLAAAPEEQLMRLWQGLGYYSRARNLQKAARIVAERYGGAFPQTYEEVMALPGIGDYTAGAILSIAFGQPVPAVDGNVLRLVSRITACRDNVLDARVRQKMRSQVAEVMPGDRPGAFNQALMDLGATVCTPNGDPRCGECPCRDFCAAHQQGRETEYPVRLKKTARRRETMTAFLLLRGEQVALRKRPDTGLLAGLWEFPHTAGDLDETQAAHWLAENHCIPHKWVKKIGWKHLFTHIEWDVTGYIIEIQGDGEPDWVWCDAVMRRQRAIPSAFAPLIKEMENGTALL